MQVDALIELGADEWHSLKAVKACMKRRIAQMASARASASAKSPRPHLPERAEGEAG